jgi:hypothetical protein
MTMVIVRPSFVLLLLLGFHFCTSLEDRPDFSVQPKSYSNLLQHLSEENFPSPGQETLGKQQRF